MKGVLFYMLQVIACSGVLYGYYHLFLRNKKFHQYNRFYLLISTLISLIIPFIHIPLYLNEPDRKPAALLKVFDVISVGHAENFKSIAGNYHYTVELYSWQLLLWCFYLLITTIIFTKFIIAVYKICLLTKQNPSQKVERIFFVNTEEEGTPFSFFRWLFWNKNIELKSEAGQKMFRHECFHICQKHSWDIVFMEMGTIIFWVNPFFHLIKKEIKTIHEFLADEFAINESDNWDYAELLLIQALGTKTNRLINPFFHNQVKRRIAMITSSKKPGYQYFRKVMVLPVVAIVFMFFAFKIKNHSETTVTKTGTPKTFIFDSQSVKDTTKPKSYFYIDEKTGKPAGYYEGVKVKSIHFNVKSEDVFIELQNGKKIKIKKEEAEKLGLPVPPPPPPPPPNEVRQNVNEEKAKLNQLKSKQDAAQEEFKKIMEEKRREGDMRQLEFKKMMEEKQREAELNQLEFKKMMEEKQREAEISQLEYKKRMEKNQSSSKINDQKAFQDEKQRDTEMMQVLLKKLMEEKQRENEISQQEFKKLMEKNQQEAEMNRQELKKVMEEIQRNAEINQQDLKKIMELKEKEDLNNGRKVDQNMKKQNSLPKKRN